MKSYFFSIFIILACFCTATAQQSVNLLNTQNTIQFREKLQLNTDRQLYIAGENVYLKVYKQNARNLFADSTSKVIYVELLNAQNNAVEQLILYTNHWTAHNYIKLPDTLSTGNYLLRAYTHWMKNFSPDLFGYQTIAVLNPFKAVSHHTANIASTSDTKAQAQIIQNQLVAPQIIGLQPTYRKREKISFDIDFQSDENETSNFSVAVYKSCFADKAKQSYFDMNTFTENPFLEQDVLQLPELEGHIVSGYVSDSLGKRLADSMFIFSVVGKAAQCSFRKTDSEGKFHFVIHEYGQKEIVIQPLNYTSNRYYVELEQPFATVFGSYHSAPFAPDTALLSEINKGIVNMQIQLNYSDVNNCQPIKTEDRWSKPSFYGAAETSIEMGEYIDLNSVQEIIKEIVPLVKSRNSKDGVSFKMLNKLTETFFENGPYILVDGVPVFVADEVVKIPAADMERIELTELNYLVGNIVLEGILHFITKKGDMSSFNFPLHIFRQAYSAYNQDIEFRFPEYDTETERNSRIPDRRNTLFWNPDGKAGINQKVPIRFYTSDETGSYTIVIEGITSKGKTMYKTANFEVE